jgi:hypothetical protein
MRVGSKRPLLAAAATASPSADSKVLITEICSRSSFDRKFVAKKTCTATALFCRKTIRVEIVIASPARTSIRCDASRPTTPSDGGSGHDLAHVLPEWRIQNILTAQESKSSPTAIVPADGPYGKNHQR